MVASHRGLESLGRVLTIGVTTCTLTALVFLPAVLTLLRGRSAPQPAVAEPLDVAPALAPRRQAA
jgi:predicted RND superfamily exporter protein